MHDLCWLPHEEWKPQQHFYVIAERRWADQERILTLKKELKNHDELIKQLQIEIGKQQEQIQNSADAGLCAEKLEEINLDDLCLGIKIAIGTGLGIELIIIMIEFIFYK